MKNKTKSLKTRIFALVAVVCLLGASVLSCLAFDEFGASATNFGTVPIYFNTNYTVFYTDWADISGWDDYTWGTPITFGDDNTYMISFPPYNTVVAYESGSDYTTFYHEMGSYSFSSIYDGYSVLGINAYYDISCGNFLIDTAEDYFAFEIQTNGLYDYAVSGVYTVIEGDADIVGDVQYFALDGSSFNNQIRYDLTDYLADMVGNDSLIFVSALTIEWESNERIDNSYQEVVWAQNETVMERNLNGARISYDDTPIVSDLMFYDAISQLFENLGIEKYKDSFVNYTADYTSWLGVAVGGFLNMELFPFFSIGGILLICVAIGLVGYFLKVFMGG